jgi:hypothetical protein
LACPWTEDELQVDQIKRAVVVVSPSVAEAETETEALDVAFEGHQ